MGATMKSEDLVKPFVGDHCLLCGGKPFCIGIFKPDNPMQYGAPAGKSRFIRYCLCEKCQSKTDTPDRVEKVLLSELNGGTVQNEE
jgi:hypothetical protein